MNKKNVQPKMNKKFKYDIYKLLLTVKARLYVQIMHFHPERIVFLVEFIFSQCTKQNVTEKKSNYV